MFSNLLIFLNFYWFELIFLPFMYDYTSLRISVFLHVYSPNPEFSICKDFLTSRLSSFGTLFCITMTSNTGGNSSSSLSSGLNLGAADLLFRARIRIGLFIVCPHFPNQVVFFVLESWFLAFYAFVITMFSFCIRLINKWYGTMPGQGCDLKSFVLHWMS